MHRAISVWTAGLSGAKTPARHSDRGFTLVELLVAMAVLALLLSITAQMIGHTTSATSSSNKQMDTASMSRIALDRIGRDFSGAVLGDGATALYSSGSPGAVIDPTKNSAIGFVTRSRARRNSSPTVMEDVRGVVLGYKVRDLTVPLTGASTASIPLLGRGDAAFTFLTASSGASQDSVNHGFSFWSMLGASSARNLPADLTAATGGDQSLLKWEGLGDGVLRFHISFVLDDGSTVQIPPAYQNLQVNGGTGDCLPVAFSAETSADPNRRYVKGLIVGLAVLDEATLRQAYLRDGNYASTLAGQLGRPQNVGETPLGVWQSNLDQVDFPPVRQNLRFYQRFFPANL